MIWAKKVKVGKKKKRLNCLKIQKMLKAKLLLKQMAA